MLHGGGRVLEDLRELRAEVGLRKLLNLKELPASCMVGGWLRRMGKDGRGLDRLDRVNEYLTQKVMAEEPEGYVLDVDATIIESEKAAAQWTYQKVKGYQPLLGFVHPSQGGDKESGKLPGLIIADEFRDGNVPAGAKAVAFLERCAEKLPEGKKLDKVRADSAWYQAEVFNWCQSRGVGFVVCADLSGASGKWLPVLGPEELAARLHCGPCEKPKTGSKATFSRLTRSTRVLFR